MLKQLTADIHYFSEKIKFTLANRTRITKWIADVAKSEKKQSGTISYIFCSDNYLLKINKQYLKHNTLTDIITFDYSFDKTVSGDIFISIHRVKENASSLGTGFEDELHRVMIHGVLHLCGYTDKTPEAKKKMRAAEDKYLKKLTNKKQ